MERNCWCQKTFRQIVLHTPSFNWKKKKSRNILKIIFYFPKKKKKFKMRTNFWKIEENIKFRELRTKLCSHSKTQVSQIEWTLFCSKIKEIINFYCSGTKKDYARSSDAINKIARGCKKVLGCLEIILHFLFLFIIYFFFLFPSRTGKKLNLIFILYNDNKKNLLFFIKKIKNRFIVSKTKNDELKTGRSIFLL